MATPLGSAFPSLSIIEDPSSSSYTAPVKRINDGKDLPHFFQSKAYYDIMSFLLQLNRSLFPSRQDNSSPSTTPPTWDIDSPSIKFSDSIKLLRSLLSTIKSFIDEAPPDPGPRRFGNIAFRRWHELLSARTSDLLSQHLPSIPSSAHEELVPYFLGSFGSPQRLDYGSGHELSFLAFLACCWKLGFFSPSHIPAPNPNPDHSSAGVSGAGASISQDNENRAVVLGVIHPYLELIRKLILTYTLEPAGSHGVWGLDDHAFIPYIFGSAQLGPPIEVSALGPTPTPTEGSHPSAPSQSDVTNAAASERHSSTNLYFGAINFIHQVKKGSFWEHSPMLFDISGVKGGWGKINKGLLKMYEVEVLGKLPVVQHLVFGSLLSWDTDPRAVDAAGRGSAHLTAVAAGSGTDAVKPKGAEGVGTKAPWATKQGLGDGGTKAPWAAGAGRGDSAGTKAPWSAGGGADAFGQAGGAHTPNRAPPPTRNPLTQRPLRNPLTLQNQADTKEEGLSGGMPPPTRAPWAK